MSFKNMNTQKLVFCLIMIVLIPMIILTIVYNVYTVSSLSSELQSIGEGHTSKFQTELDEKTALIDSYLINESTSNDFFTLCYHTDLFTRNLSLTNIINRFHQKIQDIPEIAALFIISDDFCRDRCNSYIGYPTSSVLKNYALNNLKDISASWQHHTIDNTVYLVYTYQKLDVKMVCFFSLEKLYSESLSGVYDEYICAITDPNGQIIYQSSNEVSLDDLYPPEKEVSDFIQTTSGKYLYLCKPSLHTDYMIYGLIRFTSLLTNVSVLQGLIMTLSLLLLITIPLYFFLLKKFYLTPLKLLTLDIVNMQHSNKRQLLDSSYSIQELRLFQDSLNGLLSQIDDLSKKYYEKEMETQRVQLQFFRLQLKPHFYLNCLKQIYSLQNQKKYEEAENALFYLAGYLRFLLKDDTYLIPLSDEIQCIKNYLYLYNIGAAWPITVSFQIEDSLRGRLIPMLLLETFVENSIKHAHFPDKQLQITIDVRLLDENQAYPKLYFCIHDNGSGFREDLIQTYNSSVSGISTSSTNGIGIINIMQRCHIFYNGDEFFHFSNCDGAMIEIMIPSNQ